MYVPIYPTRHPSTKNISSLVTRKAQYSSQKHCKRLKIASYEVNILLDLQRCNLAAKSVLTDLIKSNSPPKSYYLY